MKRYIKNFEVPQDIADYVSKLEAKVQIYESALSLIATGVRSDGTFNRCREACQRLAEDTLGKSAASRMSDGEANI